MFELLLILAVTLSEPEAPSRRCHFTGVCAGYGRCDDIEGTSCGTRSQASCEASYVCARHGACNWVAGTRACTGNDPSRCEGVPCKSFGQCKPGKPDTFYFCIPTAKGCPASEMCRVDGHCALRKNEDGLASCWASAKGCRESLACKRRGQCGFSPRELACMHDRKACEGTYECHKFGSCRSNGGICAYLGDEDCARSERCSVYGLCAYRYQVCDPTDRGCATTACVPPHEGAGPAKGEAGSGARPAKGEAGSGACTDAHICKQYGACTVNRNRCSRREETASCTTRAAKIKTITASTSQLGYAGLSLAADNLVDGRYDTAWVPDPRTPFPHRVRIELDSKLRVAGFRMAAGFHRIDKDEGVLVRAFGFPLGAALLTDGVVQDAFQLRRGAEWQTHLVSPVEAQVVELEIFDSELGTRFDHYAVTEIEVLVCE
jgi:hypothetical protein